MDEGKWAKVRSEMEKCDPHFVFRGMAWQLVGGNRKGCPRRSGGQQIVPHIRPTAGRMWATRRMNS